MDGKHRDGHRRLAWPLEERLRCHLEALLETFDLNPDDIVIIVDDAIDIIAMELERVTAP